MRNLSSIFDPSHLLSGLISKRRNVSEILWLVHTANTDKTLVLSVFAV